ncbi:MAG: hypothetical protein VKM97_00475 [Cyanobacteriota bacterium]|nr:hypothetical protein [Cyanobacteriota bacterium]
MAKDETSRGEELRALGWTPEEVRQYEELWEYRQRWGAINLEPEDRVFLRRAEAALPKRVAHGKGAAKKSLQEKSHYRWLRFYRDAMEASAESLGLQPGEEAAWVILLEEELRALDHYEPVLGLPDTLKAKELLPAREAWIEAVAPQGRVLSFDFDAPLEALKQQEATSWKPLRGEGARSYPVLDAEAAAAFRATVAQDVAQKIRATFPSLKDSDKPAP